jgi:hypothetical protein
MASGIGTWQAAETTNESLPPTTMGPFIIRPHRIKGMMAKKLPNTKTIKSAVLENPRLI